MSSEIQSKPKYKPNVFVIGFAAITIGFAIGYLFCTQFMETPAHECPQCPPANACNTCYPVDCQTPFDGIDIRLAKLLVSNYRNNHLAAINQNCNTVMPRQDSRSVWFSLNRIKRFIYEIEHKMCDSCDNVPNAELGVRIYFGEYPTSGPLVANIDPAYLGLHTLLMVPTYWDGQYDRDFDPAFIDPGCKPAPIDSVGAILTALPPDPQDPTQNNTNMRNHGSLFPPPYPVYSGNTVTNCSGADFLYYVDQVTCNP